MKKTALRKEFWMSVKKSRGRFLSIFLIVALGVAFFAGIRSSEPDMRISADTYYDEKNLMDIKVQSTMGLTGDDIKALKEVEGVGLAEGGYSTDVLCKIGENESVLHVRSSLSKINQIDVSKGRMPKKKDECLLDEDFMKKYGFKIGDMITFRSGTEEPLTDSLKEETFKIVGSGNSPEYISFERGSSLIGNGEVSGFVIVSPKAFSMDVYTEAYLLVKDAKEKTSYTKQYDNLVAEVKNKVEGIADVQCGRRYDELQEEAMSAIGESEEALEKAKREADTELTQAQKKLEDGEKELADGKKKIKDGKAALASGKEQLTQKESLLKQSEQEYQNGIVKVEEGNKTLRAQKEEFESGKKKAASEFAKKEKELAEGQTKLAQAKEQLDQGKALLAQKEQEFADGLSKWQEGQEQLDGAKVQFEQEKAKAEEKFTAMEVQIRELQKGLAELQKQIEILKQKIVDHPDQAEELKKQLQQLEVQYKEGTEKLQGARDTLESGRKELEEKETAFTAWRKEQKGKLDETKKMLDAGSQQIRAEKEKIKKSEEEIQKNQAKLDSGRTLLSQAKTASEKKFQSAQAKIRAAEKTIQDSEAQLSSVASQIAGGKSQITSAWNSIKQEEAKLTEGEQKIISSEQELLTGKKEYESQKAKAEEKLADGQKKIEEAKVKVNDLEEPEWYVNDRDVLVEYTGYGDNADRMRAIGKVFPELFFLVAALISLTTMTRMVEEERTQIGTLKALGYSKESIAGKYLMYAFLATMGGSILGILIGEKFLPFIIIYSYQIMYTHLPNIVIPYQPTYAVLATAAALACTLLATLYSCYKALMSHPAELMRPPAPKEGKRILLERIPILWKHLSFIWKSSIRNLFRYKKRFFMTIAGIGGCMALMIVGFGLKDSIMCIGTIQYQELQVYDGMVYLSSSVTDRQRDDVMKQMADLPKMAGYMEMEMMRQEVSAKKEGNGESVYLCVPEKKEDVYQFMTFRDRKSKEEYRLQDNGVILTEKMAKTLDVKKGDSIFLGEEGNRKKVKITDICENYMEHYVYMTEELYQEESDYNSILFDLKNISGKELSHIGEEILKFDGVINVTYTNNIEDQLNTMLESLNLVIVVLIVSAGMLAFVVLYNLNNINITERRRELATLKVLGFYDTEVGSYVYRENIMLAIFSIVVGMGLGWILHRFVITTVEVDVVMFGRIINWQSYLYSALFTIGFSLFVNWVMYYKLKKIDMVESLKSIE